MVQSNAVDDKDLREALFDLGFEFSPEMIQAGVQAIREERFILADQKNAVCSVFLAMMYRSQSLRQIIHKAAQVRDH